MELIIEEGLSVRSQIAGLFNSRGVGSHRTRTMTCHELIYVLQGCLLIREEGLEFEIKEGEYLILFPQRHHGGTAPYPEDLQFYWIHFDISPLYSKKPISCLNIPQHGTVSDPDRLLKLFLWFLEEQGSRRLRQNVSDLLLALMLEKVNDPSISPIILSQANSLAQHSQKYINTHFHKTLSASDVAAGLRCNPDYLRRIFKQVFGRTITDAIHTTRLMHARNMLLDRSDNIDQISAAVGYPDPGYFCRMFKRYENMSPREFRKLYTRIQVNTE